MALRKSSKKALKIKIFRIFSMLISFTFLTIAFSLDTKAITGTGFIIGVGDHPSSYGIEYGFMNTNMEVNSPSSNTVSTGEYWSTGHGGGWGDSGNIAARGGLYHNMFDSGFTGRHPWAIMSQFLDNSQIEGWPKQYMPSISDLSVNITSVIVYMVSLSSTHNPNSGIWGLTFNYTFHGGDAWYPWNWGDNWINQSYSSDMVHTVQYWDITAYANWTFSLIESTTWGIMIDETTSTSNHYLDYYGLDIWWTYANGSLGQTFPMLGLNYWSWGGFGGSYYGAAKNASRATDYGQNITDDLEINPYTDINITYGPYAYQYGYVMTWDFTRVQTNDIIDANNFFNYQEGAGYHYYLPMNPNTTIFKIVSVQAMIKGGGDYPLPSGYLAVSNDYSQLSPLWTNGTGAWPLTGPENPSTHGNPTLYGNWSFSPKYNTTNPGYAPIHVWNITGLFNWSATDIVSNHSLRIMWVWDTYPLVPTFLDYIGIMYTYVAIVYPHIMGNDNTGISIIISLMSFTWMVIFFLPGILLSRIFPGIGFIAGATLMIIIYGFSNLSSFFPYMIICFITLIVLYWKGY